MKYIHLERDGLRLQPIITYCDHIKVGCEQRQPCGKEREVAPGICLLKSHDTASRFCLWKAWPLRSPWRHKVTTNHHVLAERLVPYSLTTWIFRFYLSISSFEKLEADEAVKIQCGRHWGKCVLYIWASFLSQQGVWVLSKVPEFPKWI